MSELLIRFHVVHYIIRITDPGKHRFKKTIRNTIIILVNNLKFVTEFVTTWYAACLLVAALAVLPLMLRLLEARRAGTAHYLNRQNNRLST